MEAKYCKRFPVLAFVIVVSLAVGLLVVTRLVYNQKKASLTTEERNVSTITPTTNLATCQLKVKSSLPIRRSRKLKNLNSCLFYFLTNELIKRDMGFYIHPTPIKTLYYDKHIGFETKIFIDNKGDKERMAQKLALTLLCTNKNFYLYQSYLVKTFGLHPLCVRFGSVTVKCE